MVKGLRLFCSGLGEVIELGFKVQGFGSEDLGFRVQDFGVTRLRV